MIKVSVLYIYFLLKMTRFSAVVKQAPTGCVIVIWSRGFVSITKFKVRLALKLGWVGRQATEHHPLVLGMDTRLHP